MLLVITVVRVVAILAVILLVVILPVIVIRIKEAVLLVPLEDNCQSGRRRSRSLPPGGTRGT